MKSITLKKVQYSYGERNIFSNVSVTCTEKERLCILGENGVGKSTLLKILCGDITPDAGSVEKGGHVRFVYVEQEFPKDASELTVSEYINTKIGVSLTKRVEGIAEELGFDITKIDSKALCKSFSGGQQKILALSVALATNPDFLLLDEPENHLDIVSRMILIRMLQEYRGGIVFISHDRLVIDSIATKVAELAQGEVHISEGTYDDYIEDKMARIGGMQRAFDAETKRIKQLEQTVVILKQKAIRGKEISAYQRKLAELNELKKSHKESGRPEEKKTKIKISQGGPGFHDGKLLARMEKIGFKYPDGKAYMFKNVSLEVRTGTHIALLGRNGAGKSTFLKCLTGELPLTEGEISWASTYDPTAKIPEKPVTFAYFDQHMSFDPERKPVDVVMEKLNCFEMEARAALGAMRFDLTRQQTPIGRLSGGERMRLRFAIVFGKKPDFLILDEPTNHIDEVTWEVLLSACKLSKSTILLVSHDYEFIQEFKPGLFWVIGNQTVTPRWRDLGELLAEMGGDKEVVEGK
ncbi:MAG: ABC-F family ATP-binding cassette domain-containing protein [Candidatus Taylorbacteria bacterium]|nr:ABC-F family ATP-binding cassette domain-containing protein [Candidatus Taylorbacteria bacterium]